MTVEIQMRLLNVQDEKHLNVKGQRQYEIFCTCFKLLKIEIIKSSVDVSTQVHRHFIVIKSLTFQVMVTSLVHLCERL